MNCQPVWQSWLRHHLEITSHLCSFKSCPAVWDKAKFCMRVNRCFLCPLLQRCEGAYCFRVVCDSVPTLFDACHVLWTLQAMVLKFHIWISHEKIDDPYFFLLSLSWVMPLQKYRNEILSLTSKSIWALAWVLLVIEPQPVRRTKTNAV